MIINLNCDETIKITFVLIKNLHFEFFSMNKLYDVRI